MRTALCLAFLTACPYTSYTGTMCTPTSQVSQCGSEDVCADDFRCEPASDLVVAHVTWTVGGQAANATTCANVPSMFLQFSGNPSNTVVVAVDETVSCTDGMFTATKLPKEYDQALMFDDVTQQVLDATAIVDGTAMLDLP
jgi:hypothetical protein